MSDMDNSRKDTDTSSVEQELTADELAASLCRQISGEESEQPSDEDVITTIEQELSEVLGQDQPEDDDPEALIRELQSAAADELASLKEESPEEASEEILAEEYTEEETPEEADGHAEEEISEGEAESGEEENSEEKSSEEAAEQMSEDPAESGAEETAESAEEETAEEAAESAEEEISENAAESVEEETPVETAENAEENNSEEPGASPEEAEAEDGAAEAPEEEAFDKEDTDVIDVSSGVLDISEAPTMELPNIPHSIALPEEEEPKLSKRALKKEEKQRRKQEAAESKAREKQEARERKEQKKQEKAEKKANRKKGPVKIILILLLALLAAAAVVYMALSNRYKTVFFDGTKINGADCTGLTVEEAETVIARQMDDYDLTLIFRDGKKEVINGDSIDFAYVPDGSVQEIKDEQIPIQWLTAFFDEYSYEATAGSSYDLAKLTQAVTELEECNIVNMTAPVNASLAYSEESKKLEIVPEQQGNKFDLSALMAAVEDAIRHGDRELNLEEKDLYEKPARTAEDAELLSQQQAMNDAISSVITYQLPDGSSLVLDANILVNWLSLDEAGNYSVNPEIWGTNIANFVEDVARAVNTSDSKANFKTRNGGTVTLDNYLKGWLVDEEAEAAQLTEELAGRAVVEREPIYSQRAYSDKNNGIGNTYVEVDLTAQYLWVVDNGEVIIESPVVSGTMVPSRYTPEGIYPLYGKQKGRYLRGTQYADGTYEYESWVDYWMPFNGGIGLHDASWRVDFGGSTYIGGGSHGCINLPSGKAAAIFDWISAGTPVVCYYSGGYTLAPEGTYGE